VCKQQANHPSVQAWAIHNIIFTLHAALPEDADDSALPVRSLLSHVLSLTEPLALELMEQWGHHVE
jgi:hypothetical protein